MRAKPRNRATRLSVDLLSPPFFLAPWTSNHCLTSQMSLFSGLPEVVPDAAFSLVEAYAADASPLKVDLSPGFYRDENAKPWVLPSVQKVAAVLVASEVLCVLTYIFRPSGLCCLNRRQITNIRPFKVILGCWSMPRNSYLMRQASALRRLRQYRPSQVPERTTSVPCFWPTPVALAKYGSRSQPGSITTWSGSWWTKKSSVGHMPTLIPSHLR